MWGFFLEKNHSFVIMTKTKLILFILLFGCAIGFTCLCIPPKFYTEGGSCMQGIGVAIHLLILIISAFFALASLTIGFIRTFNKSSVELSCVALAVWAFWFLNILVNDSVSTTIYLVPYLAASIALVVINIKTAK
jgi:hypothetical protein